MNKVHVAATELQQLLKQNTNIIGATTAQSRCHFTGVVCTQMCRERLANSQFHRLPEVLPSRPVS